MKAQILKIAGVKTEAEFYKKYPTEEAFMKKHGKELKKAQYGTYVAGMKEQPAQKPIAYDDLYQDTMAAMTGVSREEKARQDALAAMQADKSSDSSGILGSLGQLAGQIAPMLSGEGGGEGIASLAGAIGKNGKKLKKAQTGTVMGAPFQGMPSKPTSFSVSSNSGFNTDVSNNPYMSGSLIGGQKAQSSSGSWAANPYINSPFKASQSVPSSSGFDWKGMLGKAAPVLANQLGPLIGSFEQIDQNKKDIAKANQWADISQLGAQAALSRTEKSKRRYARPEDNLVTPMNPLGKKDSLLAAQNGAEIANTFAPNTIYTDGGYQPLNDSNPKQYTHGGYLHKAQAGVTLDSFAGIGGGLGGALGSAIGKGTGKGGPGSQIGSTIGGVLGMAIPIPGVGSFIGSTLGGLAGGLFDAADQNKLQAAQDRQQNAITQATLGSGAASIQNANKAFMKNGGYMNPEYNPQVIAKFGDYDIDQLLVPPHDADMLRAGGHLKEYTAPSAAAMYTGRDLPYQMEDGGQMAMGGDLQVERGKAETLSYNPFLPDGGETIMFRGPSHDNGGMPISFGENGVEVEGGEPAIKLQDGGEEGNLVVYGNMVIPEYGAVEIGDKNAKGKKFKHYVADLSKTEAKQNKLIDRTSSMLEDINGDDSFDQLKLNTGQANLLGANMKLKSIADKKKNAAVVQNAILDTASEHGLESDALAKGKIKYAKANDPYAKFGTKLDKFQKGGKKELPVTLSTIAETLPSSFLPGLREENIAAKVKVPTISSEFIPGISKLPPVTYDKFDITNYIPSQQSFFQGVPMKNSYGTFDPVQGMYVNDELDNVTVTAKRLTGEPTPALSLSRSDVSPAVEEKTKAKFPWEDVITGINSGLPFLRPSNQIPLDPSQLAGEIYALSQNAEDPVFAQSYQPLLSQATTVSLQDQLNEITAQSRAAERMAQGNPAALAMIASQAAEAKNKVLGEQFRMNQGEAQRVAETNRQTMNEAQKMNLGLYDQQQQRAAQAKSNTKAQAIAALNSISDKIAKQKLENRQMAISENLYNYRFSPSGVAYSLNPAMQWTPSGSATGTKNTNGFIQDAQGNTLIPEYATDGSVKNYMVKKEKKERNGSIVKAIKGL